MLANLRIDRAAVLGWSLGGNVAFDMIAPGISGVMAICASPVGRHADGGLQGYLPHPKIYLAGAPELSEAETDAVLTLVTDYAVSPEPFWRESVGRTDGRARQQMFAAMLAPDYPGQRELVENSRVPVALVVGGDDGFVDSAYLSSLKCANLWSGAVVVFDGLGHAPHLHAPDRFVPVLEAFLADVA